MIEAVRFIDARTMMLVIYLLMAVLFLGLSPVFIIPVRRLMIYRKIITIGLIISVVALCLLFTVTCVCLGACFVKM